MNKLRKYTSIVIVLNLICTPLISKYAAHRKSKVMVDTNIVSLNDSNDEEVTDNNRFIIKFKDDK